MSNITENSTDSLWNRLVARWHYYADEYPNFVPTMLMGSILVAMTLFFYALEPRFLIGSNIRIILAHTAAYFILAVGMTMVITTAGIDISVGAQMGLIVVVTGMALRRWNMPVPVAFLIALGTGTLTGAFNSIFISRFKVPPIIVTLGGFSFFRGVAYVIIRHEILFDFPAEFLWLARARILGLPPAVYLAVIFMVFGVYLLNETTLGRHISAVGGNEEAASMSGISPGKVKFFVYTFMGFTVAVASLIWMGRMNAAQAAIGYGLELHVIASVVLGGTSLFGGRGLMIGSFMGALMLGVVENGLLVIGLPWFVQQVFLGAIFIGVVVFWTVRQKGTA